jgi:hypothetical protein
MQKHKNNTIINKEHKATSKAVPYTQNTQSQSTQKNNNHRAKPNCYSSKKKSPQ